MASAARNTLTDPADYPAKLLVGGESDLDTIAGKHKSRGRTDRVTTAHPHGLVELSLPDIVDASTAVIILEGYAALGEVESIAELLLQSLETGLRLRAGPTGGCVEVVQTDRPGLQTLVDTIEYS